MASPGDLLKILLRRMSPPYFTIRIRDGEAILQSGKATPAFLHDCGLIVKRRGIRSGWIWGIRAGASIKLDFSGSISKGDRQRFRNVMGVHT